VSDAFDLTGLRALVTGGGTGIGRAIAAGLLTAGAEVTICGRRSAQVDEAVDELGAGGGAIRGTACDVTVEDDLQGLVAFAGDVDILVNNAGYARNDGWADVTREQWREVMAVNVEGPLRLCQLLIPPMAERGWGRVINITSLYATLAPEPGRYPGFDIDIPSYVASKHALLGLTRHLAVAVGRQGVTVNALSPGMIPATQSEPVPTEVVDALAAGAPLGRVGEPEELQTAALFLASRKSGFVNGQNINVDGGWTTW
jgi:NAD(P)-dependent dehydrogenase (short-subunit alcohol dehydrogenase family)